MIQKSSMYEEAAKARIPTSEVVDSRSCSSVSTCYFRHLAMLFKIVRLTS